MKKVTKAIIPVAGLGTRFLPITKGVAKELLPIVDKPTLQYIIEECVASGIEDIYLITSPLKPAISNYFERNERLEHLLEEKGKLEQVELIKSVSDICRLHYLVQEKPLGSGHAIALTQEFINEPFAVLFGDDLMMADKPVLKQLIDIYEEKDCNVIGVREVLKQDVSRYGIIDFADTEFKIKNIVEKPAVNEAPSNYAGLGRYILKPEIFAELNLLPDNEEKFIVAMLNLMKKQDFYACAFDGKYYDIGNKFGYIKANIEFGLKRDDIKEELETYIKNFN